MEQKEGRKRRDLREALSFASHVILTFSLAVTCDTNAGDEIQFLSIGSSTRSTASPWFKIDQVGCKSEASNA
ncbi:hypothetical protein BDQ12DRAFT_725963 [Crucibulum laeve]|uniref:Uncharacterized protein n=1 Tax=Crucibulum laeve TaxID=68775 RepID=A0A5C3LSS4_9AGAR|nr:hypothetical protein BDQ12DRAFT_725963 [Crucibulum laeve]